MHFFQCNSMAVLPDFAGLGGMSLKSLVWTMYGLICFWTLAILIFMVTLHHLNRHDVLEVFIIKITAEWFEVVTYTCWFVCAVWGFLAISLPVRPREPKRKALMFWIFLIVVHAIGHSVFVVMLCKRCHNFFSFSLAGNLAKETVETFLAKQAQNQYVQTALYVFVPIANVVSAPFIFQFLGQLPPLNFFFWMGWNWVVVAFIVGVIPMLCYMTTITVVLGYVNAIDHGGNGTERCAPSKIALFYSLEYEERTNIRKGFIDVETFQHDLSTGEEGSSGSSGDSSSVVRSGTHSSSLRSYTGSDVSSESEEKGPKRIPSYKPNRSYVPV